MGGDGASSGTDSGQSRLVYPGERLGADEGSAIGHGIRSIDGNLVAMRMGILQTHGKVLSVNPLNSRYVPRAGDLIIGFVEGMTNNIWFIDIGAPFNAILPMSLGPSKAEFGGIRKVLDIGDAILCRVQEVEENHSSVVTMKGMGLRAIRTGSVEDIDPHLLGRLIGRGGNNLRQLKEDTECRVIAGDNGRIWLDGDLSGIVDARDRLNMLLTEAKIEEYRGDA